MDLFLWLLFWIESKDPDYFWHLKAGEYIVSHMALPSGDPFSYTFQGKPWVVSAWLFEVVLYGVFTLLGTTGQGGYLIYHLYPEQQVFIDGRADIYGEKHLMEYFTILYGSQGWDKAFDKYSVDYLIVRRDDPIRERLRSRGDFKMVYDDAAHSVLVRKLSRFEQLAAQNAE